MQSRVVNIYANNHIENNINEPMIDDFLAQTAEYDMRVLSKNNCHFYS